MRPFSIVPTVLALICVPALSMDFAMARQPGDEVDAEHLVQEVADIWSQHNAEKVDDVFTEDGIYEDVASRKVMRGRQEIKSNLRRNFFAVPDFKVELTGVFATKDRAACEWIMSGTHTGDYPELPATGKSFSVRGASIVLLEGEKIKHWTDYYNMYDFSNSSGSCRRQQNRNDTNHE
jgi:steroid delta-isomerase-like uncharacterized protein